MQNEEQIFDFLAAAEETGKQLDNMAKCLPAEISTALTEAWQKSPWQTELPKLADRVNAAAEHADNAAQTLIRKANHAGYFVCLATVVIPLLTWGFAYWQTSKIRREQITVKAETSRLESRLADLNDETGGGVELFKDDNGFRVVALPPGVAVEKTGHLEDGRFAFTYTLPKQ